LEGFNVAENDEQIVVRLPKALVERVDEVVERAKKDQPGMRITRSDAVRMLLLRALDDNEPKKRKR
jgi:metal-responsive CopG/Arc/MetJ family transcriptional regulator